jgi:3'-5' exoribonuclease
LIFIREFIEGDRIIGHYFCREKRELVTKAGKTYWSLVLSDKTGEISAKIWELTTDIQDYDAGECVKIDADVQIYRMEPQLNVKRIRASRDDEYNIRDYEKTTDKDIDELWNQLADFILSVEDPDLNTLLSLVFTDDTISEAFKRGSAAKSLHHGYIGGLLEHTVSVIEICDFMAARYKHINRDLLITAAALHDLCKIYELSPPPSYDYTDEGKLLGHIVLGTELVERFASEIEGFPYQTKLMLKHCLLSHHGEFEFGSPKLPQTAEAVLLHLCDNLDAKAKSLEETLSAAENSPAAWTGRNRMIDRNVRKTGI